jgi:ParB-like chromosome segregation protein Spo0J
VTLVPHEDHFEILDGVHRCNAALRLGHKAVDAIVLEVIRDC